jgi:DHA2 family multidrug resistance protein-like MFS transporter
MSTTGTPAGAASYTDTTSPPRAGRKEWIGLAVIALPCLIYSMDLTVLHMAVPQLSRDLKPSSTQLLWIIDIYGFMVAGFLISAGTLGDRIGRRRLLLIGAAMFAVASVAAAYSTTPEMLVVTRALLGLAGATVAPSTLSLIRNMFHDEQQRTRAISVWITAYSLGGIVGPLVGGVLLENFWWGSVFLIAVPVMALVLILGPFVLPEYKDPRTGLPDVTSALLSLGAIIPVILGVKRIAQDGVTPIAIVALLAGAVVGAVFVRRQLRLADPLLDLRLFTVPGFSAALASYGLTGFMLFGIFLFIPQYLQLVKGMSPLIAGIWSIPWAAAFVVGSLGCGALVQRWSRGSLIAAGFAIAAAASLMFLSMDEATSFAWFGIATTFIALGTAPVVTLTTDIVIGTAPPERAGAAGALSETSAELGGALGIAIFGSIGVAAYRLALGDSLPAELPPQSAESIRSTLGAALDVTATLPAQLRGQVETVAREAFLYGLRAGAIVAAVGMAVLAPFAWLRIRPRASAGAPSAQG